MRTICLATTALILFGVFSISCGGGGGGDSGGLVGFSTGTSQAGPVPSDGSSPAAPVVTGAVVTNNPVKNGDPLHVTISFSDTQGDIASVNVGIAGQNTHSSISVASVGTQTNGNLFLDLKPGSSASGSYVLVVSITDAAGHTSVAVSIPFVVLTPSGTLPGGGTDAAVSPDLRAPSMETGAPDLRSPGVDTTVADANPRDAALDVTADVTAVDAGVADVADVASVTDVQTTADAATDAPCATGGVVQSTTTGGLWYEAGTWVCGVVPTATDDVQINGEVQVNQSAAKTVATCRNLTVAATGVLRGAAYTASQIRITGDLVNQGAVRNGPPYASYDTATLVVYVGGNITQNALYGAATHFTGATPQTITYGAGIKMTGTFIDDDPASSLKAGSDITADATTLTLGTETTPRSTLDMGTFTLTLASGDFKVAFGILRATKIVGVLGATLSADQMVAVAGTLNLEGDVCTGSTSINGSVAVAAKAAFYNQSNTDAVITIAGGLTNNGIVRSGPGYAAYGAGTMSLNVSGDFAQNGDYTVAATTFNGSAAQTIRVLAGKVLTGKFTDTVTASPLQAGSDLNITEAEFVLPADAALAMGTYKVTHPSGNLKIATGTLAANDLTGDTTGEAPFSVVNIAPPSGTLTVHGHFRTGSVTVTGNLALGPAVRMYNQVHVQANVTVTGTVTSDATAVMGSGPGYASYDSGSLYLNGTKLAAW